MKTIKLYRYQDGNATIVTPTRPSKSGYKTLSRLVADEGKILVNGDRKACVIDTYEPKAWSEVDNITETEEQ